MSEFKFVFTPLNIESFPYFMPEEVKGVVAGFGAGAFRQRGVDVDAEAIRFVERTGLDLSEPKREWRSSLGGYTSSVSMGR